MVYCECISAVVLKVAQGSTAAYEVTKHNIASKMEMSQELHSKNGYSLF